MSVVYLPRVHAAAENGIDVEQALHLSASGVIFLLAAPRNTRAKLRVALREINSALCSPVRFDGCREP